MTQDMTEGLRLESLAADVAKEASPHDDPTRVPIDATQSLIEQIARALVDHPEAVTVQAVVRDESTVLRLHVSDADIGKVIGKQGRTAHSLRTILSAVSMKYHHRYTLDIVETSSPHGADAHGAEVASRTTEHGAEPLENHG